jgi:GT2 family glycosyltransferase
MIPGAVTVGFLHPGHYAACFAESFKEMLLTDLIGGQRIVSHDHGQLALHTSSAGIVEGRNTLAKFMCDHSQAEWLFMVDSDMGFNGDTLERLIATADPVERPVVGALCFGHRKNGKASFGGMKYISQPTIYDWHEDDDIAGWLPRFDYQRDALTRCSGTGGACVLIHRTVFERMRDMFGDEWFTPINHAKAETTFSEDLSFCIRLAALGLPLFVHAGIKTTHDKGGVFLDEELFESQQSAK